MILVADSGSTKCDWILVTEDGTFHETNTMGFNPFFHTTELIAQKVRENDLLSSNSKEVIEIYFYGAGCSSADRNEIVAKGLKQVFVNASKVVVDHDLTGAAIATTQGSKGIACILGTGSNSCYFDGIKVEEKIPALGYILGDEGSGSYFGKIMLSDWLYNRMPGELQKNFGEEYNLTKEAIFENVYNKPNANVYLASFMKFASSNKHVPYFKDMMYQGMARFSATHIWCFENFREVPVNFVGSIAYYFSEVLEEVAINHRFTPGKIEKRPVEPLAHYHYSQYKTSNEFERLNI